MAKKCGCKGKGKNNRGEHEAGFKELSWNKKTLDEFIRRSKHEK